MTFEPFSFSKMRFSAQIFCHHFPFYHDFDHFSITIFDHYFESFYKWLCVENGRTLAWFSWKNDNFDQIILVWILEWDSSNRLSHFWNRNGFILFVEIYLEWLWNILTFMSWFNLVRIHFCFRFWNILKTHPKEKWPFFLFL